MSSWWKKRLPLSGSVLFRGDLPHQPSEFSFLENTGIRVIPHPKDSRTSWSLGLSHSEWGNAELAYDMSWPLPSRWVLEYSFMPRLDKDAAISARSMVVIRMDSRHGNILRDRKLMLRFLRAVMGDDGLVAIDYMPMRIWSRDDLDDELSHNADLDVEGITNLHAVYEKSDRAHWIHSHGLSEVGAFDYDILDPSSETRSNIQELHRAVAFHILEGRLGPSTAEFELVEPRGTIKMVEMRQFLKNTDAARRAKFGSDVDEQHLQNHSVMCEPEGRSIARLLGGRALRPASIFTKDLPDNPVFGFSQAATELMAERARNTYPLLRALSYEFVEFDFPCIIKLGIRVDGRTGTNREHMWFVVHKLFDSSIDATLANRPYDISGMKEGDRGQHSIDLISDWAIMTPVGTITPRSATAARMVRADPERVRRMMKQG